MKTETYCLNNNSLIPAIKESEKFIKFLNEKFKLNLPNDFLISIHKAGKGKIGFFSPKGNSTAFKIKEQEKVNPLHSINLNTLYLNKSNPYEVLTHELAHFINEVNNVKDCSSNQYHNKHFKETAEILLLKVSKTKRGYSQTEETDEFNKMIREFKPDKEVFNIFQEVKTGIAQKSRLFLYMCECEIKIRSGLQDLDVKCNKCKKDFIRK